MPTDVDILRAAQASARMYANQYAGSPSARVDAARGADQAAITGYENDVLADGGGVVRRDLWDGQQELLYRYAFAQQLLALGL